MRNIVQHPLYGESKKKKYTDELTKQKQTADFENKFMVVGGRTHGVPHGTLLSVMWQPRWEGSLGENGYMGKYD